MEQVLVAVVAAILGSAGGLFGSWLLFARGTVTRAEVSAMIATETPLALRTELELVRKEIGELRVDVAKLTGVLEMLVKGQD